MPSALFLRVRNRRLAERLGAALGGSYAPKRSIRTGIVVTDHVVAVEGQQYEMSSAGMGLAQGAPVSVVNVGRLAAAQYRPADAWGGTAATGSG
jgi:hypothetical protein